MKIKIFAVSVIMAAFFAATSAMAQDAPAAQLEESNASVYRIVRHDTLWGISKRFLKDPLKWPKIWRQNPYIKNPDLIFPGNAVKIFPDGSVEIVKEPGPKELPTVVLEQPEEKVVELKGEAPPAGKAKEAPGPKDPVAPNTVTDAMPRKGFIASAEFEAAGVIIEPLEKESRLYVTRGERVLLSLKDKRRAKIGSRYAVFLEGKRIFHPVTGAYLGNVTNNLGILTITDASPGQAEEGVIEASYKEIPLGAKLTPLREVPKEVVIKNATSEIKGLIIAAADDRNELSQGAIVYIDKGVKDGVNAGNVFKIYRGRNKISDPMESNGALNLPPLDLGSMIVMDAGESASTCIIVDSLKVINVGDGVVAEPAAKELSSK